MIREKQQITTKGNKKATKKQQKGTPIRLSADFSAESLQSRREWHLKWWKGKTYSQAYSTQQDFHSDLMEKFKALQTSKSWKEFNTAKPVLQQMLKELL